MLKSLLASSLVLIVQLPSSDSEFARLQRKLEIYGFQVNIAIPPEFPFPTQQPGMRRSVRKPYGVFHAPSKSIWINPIVFDLGVDLATLVHETVHAAQYCAGDGTLQTLGLDLEPIPQALPFFRRYVHTQRQDLEREAYTVQTQPHSYELANSLLEHHCENQRHTLQKSIKDTPEIT